MPQTSIEPSSTRRPVVLTIAGSDSSAGAGIQADLKTFAALGCYGVNAVTALVAESPGAVDGLSTSPSALFSSQLKRVKSSFPILGVKTGMLGNEEIVDVVVLFMKENPELDLVIDPVIRASAGTELLSPGGLTALKKDLIPRSTLITPNLPEAEILLGKKIETYGQIKTAALKLNEQFGCSVLVKGGHLKGEDGDSEVVDYASIDGETFEFKHAKLDLPDLHGTGCTLASAITARLAHGDELPQAIEAATAYLAQCMIQHHFWPALDHGIRALNHFPDQVE